MLVRTLKEAYNEIKKIDTHTGITMRMIRVLVANGEIPCRKIGVKQMVSVESIINYFESNAS